MNFNENRINEWKIAEKQGAHFQNYSYLQNYSYI